MSVHDDFYVRSDSSGTAEAERAGAQVQGVQVAFRHFSFVLSCAFYTCKTIFLYILKLFLDNFIKKFFGCKKRKISALVCSYC